MRFLVVISIWIISCGVGETNDVQGVWQLNKVEGNYYSFLNGVLYEFEYGRTYELYLTDSLFYFPSLIPSEEGCLPFVCNYQLESGVLVLDSVGESYEITRTDSLLFLSTEEYALAFNFQEEVRSIESNFSEIYFEIYFDG